MEPVPVAVRVIVDRHEAFAPMEIEPFPAVLARVRVPLMAERFAVVEMLPLALMLRFPLEEETTPEVERLPLAVMLRLPVDVMPVEVRPALDCVIEPEASEPETAVVEPADRVRLVTVLELKATVVLLSVRDTEPPEGMLTVPAFVLRPALAVLPPFRLRVVAERVPAD
jgi:hypothetical protein